MAKRDRPYTSTPETATACRRAWSPEDLSRLRRLVALGWHDAQIGEELGRDRVVICRKRRALDLKPGQSHAMTVAIRRIRARRRAAEAAHASP
jgi:hypothetical protein